ncbi:MAG: antitoxin VbhA family protein [Candidatus Velthaea sp.]|jgi:hypothetical protein
METKPTPEELAETYRNANASLAIEGMHMTPEDLTLQQRVIDGEWTHEQFREHVVMSARERDAGRRAS